MQLIIDGQKRDLIPIHDFREQHGLPQTFGVAGYEPKNFEGLAAIDRAGAGLAHIKATLPTRIPQRLLMPQLLPAVEALQASFDKSLLDLNERIGLRPQEIDFAVAGLGDVLRRWAYALVAESAGGERADFMTVYGYWLADSVRLNSEVHDFKHGDALWNIQVISYVYGRVGLRVRAPDMFYYVADTVYSCPATSYMNGLITELAERIALAVR